MSPAIIELSLFNAACDEIGRQSMHFCLPGQLSSWTTKNLIFISGCSLKIKAQ